MILSAFKTYVKQDFPREDKDTELVQAYNDMIRWVAVQMPVGNYKYQSYITTSVGVEDFELPCDMIHMIHPAKLMLGSGASDSGYPLERISKAEYDIIEPNPNRSSPNKGRPSKYCVYSRSMLLTPVPDLSTYIIEINWTKLPSERSESSDVPYLGNEWDQVLKCGTLERLYAGLGQWDESAQWGAKYHQVTPTGDDMPMGMCKKLFEIEKDREEFSVGTIENNSL